MNSKWFHCARAVGGRLDTTVVMAAVLVISAFSAFGGTTERVSVGSQGQEGDGNSMHPSLSTDSRFVAFSSNADNLVGGDTNDTSDVFLHDRQFMRTEILSMGLNGEPANGVSGVPHLSADARYLVFSSNASNLVRNDTNEAGDVFVHDRQTGKTTRVSINSSGEEANSSSTVLAMSPDARYVVFASTATNLVPGVRDGTLHAFVRDRETEETTIASVSSTGEPANAGVWVAFVGAVSADGRYVAFDSKATNLVDDDTNASLDVFVHDRQKGETTRVSISSDGVEGDQSSAYPAMSADGRYVAFASRATNLVKNDANGVRDIFVHDRETAETTRVSITIDGQEADDDSRYPAISGDGRYVVFNSLATNIVEGDTNETWDVFLYDRWTGRMERVSVSSDGSEQDFGADAFAGGNGSIPAVTNDGLTIGFISLATNLVDDDTNGLLDVFVRVRCSGDLNGDGTVDVFDLLVLLGSWGPCPDPPDACPADLNGDSSVGILDLLILLANWG